MVLIVLHGRLKDVILGQENHHCLQSRQVFAIVIGVFLQIVTYGGIMDKVIFYWELFCVINLVTFCIRASSWVRRPCTCTIDARKGGNQTAEHLHCQPGWHVKKL